MVADDLSDHEAQELFGKIGVEAGGRRQGTQALDLAGLAIRVGGRQVQAGLDVPDTGLTPDNLKDTSDAFNNALNECMMKVSGMTGEDNVANDPAAREAMVKAAQCLREAGYDVKDPQPGEGISVKDIPEDVLNKCFQQSGAAK